MIPRIIIEISGGVLQNVYSDQPIQYVLVDHDNLEEFNNLPLAEDFPLSDQDDVFEDINDQINKLLN